MKSFKVKQPKNVKDVYSQSFDSINDLGSFTYKNTIKLFGAMRARRKSKEVMTMPKKGKKKSEKKKE